jgi:hypothetical protein
VRARPAGHAGQPHAIANNVPNLSVREILRSRQPQIRNFGVQAAPNSGLSRAILAMTTRTAIQEALARFLQNLRRRLPRIFFAARLLRYCQVSCRSSYRSFQIRRLVSGAKAMPNQPRPIQPRSQQRQSSQGNKSFPAFQCLTLRFALRRALRPGDKKPIFRLADQNKFYKRIRVNL